MAVVINELEVVPAAPAASAGAAPSTSEASASPPDPREIERAVARQMERCARVRAH
ncbi:MAG TPA: hypothetical protein VGL70_00220 [Candidatus Binatia bacterium]|jgi:hypothetical protein